MKCKYTEVVGAGDGPENYAQRLLVTKHSNHIHIQTHSYFPTDLSFKLILYYCVCIGYLTSQSKLLCPISLSRKITFLKLFNIVL